MNNNPIITHIDNLYQAVRDLELQFDRPSRSVNILAVSKGQPISKLTSAFLAGQRHLGENYLQEAQKKQEQLQDYPFTWHYIGRIQSNKIKTITRLFTWVHTIPSLSIAQAFNEEAGLLGKPLNACIQVRLAEETERPGLILEDLVNQIKPFTQLTHLRWRGLMYLPALNLSPSPAQAFNTIHQAFQTLKSAYPHLDTLSMGMSGDYPLAIASGSTCIRLGTAFFGERI